MSVCEGRTAATARDTVRVGPLEIDRAPVTNARYAAFVAATGHRPPLYWPNGAFPETLADHPVVGVDFFDALAFAIWAKGRLPTELEWCEATGLAEHRAFVWGDTFDAKRCNTVRSDVRGTTPVGAYPEGTAPSGCVDMCGNVWEMTCTAYPGDDTAIVVKGGSWYDFPVHAKIDTSFRARVQKCGNTVGFRLVYGSPLQLPAFLDPDLAVECIEFRRREPAGDAPGGEAAGEFDSIVSDLRKTAARHLPALHLEDTPGVQLTNVAAALAIFDAADTEPLPAVEPARVTSDHAPTLRERVQDILAKRPRTTLALLCAAIGAVLSVAVAASSDGDATRKETAERIARRTPVARRRATTGGATPRDRDDLSGRARPRSRSPAPTPPPRAPHRTPLQEALHDLVYGTASARAEAETWLIGNPDECYEQVRDALRGRIKPPVRSSLRYVLAAIDEQRADAATPHVVSREPREGLVYFIDAVTDELGDEIVRARRTAKAELVPLTIVVEGQRRADGILATYGSLLGDVRFFADLDGGFARAMHVTQKPALIGLRPDGRLAFVLLAPATRPELARNAASLRR